MRKFAHRTNFAGVVLFTYITLYLAIVAFLLTFLICSGSAPQHAITTVDEGGQSIQWKCWSWTRADTGLEAYVDCFDDQGAYTALIVLVSQGASVMYGE